MIKWRFDKPTEDAHPYLVWIDKGFGGYAMILDHGRYGWNGVRSKKHVINGVVAWAEIDPPNLDGTDPLPLYSQSDGD